MQSEVKMIVVEEWYCGDYKGEAMKNVDLFSYIIDILSLLPLLVDNRGFVD